MAIDTKKLHLMVNHTSPGGKKKPAPKAKSPRKPPSPKASPLPTRPAPMAHASGPVHGVWPGQPTVQPVVSKKR